MEDTFYNDLLIELECPICTNYMSPPIRQCATGHSICEACRKKLPKCALCQGKFTDSRNISLEGLAMKMHYPCINKESGCNMRLKYNEREAHELKCLFKGFKCPMEKCSWKGNLNEIARHWASKKITSKPYHANNVCHTKMKSESYYVNIVEAYNNMFWFKCKLSNKKLFWAVQYIGPSHEARNYFYEIEIFKPGDCRRKILLSEYCESVDIENSTLFKEGVCTFIYTDMVNQFVSDDQLLVYNMRVYTDQTNFAQPKIETRTTEREQRDRSKGPQGLFKEQRDRSRGPQGRFTEQRDRSKGPQHQFKDKFHKFQRNKNKGGK